MAVTGGLWFFQSHVVPTQGWGVGQLVQVRFKGCPDVILRAAYDSNGEPANYDKKWASVSTDFCEMPLAEKLGGNSTWIVDAGWGYKNSPSGGDEFCASVTSTWGNEEMTCSEDSGCFNVLACDTSLNDTNCKDKTPCGLMCPGDTQNPQCPCGVQCAKDPRGAVLNRDGICQLSVVPTFSCVDGWCKLTRDKGCPPLATCSILGTEGQERTNGPTVNYCSASHASVTGTNSLGQLEYDPKHPCTGCDIGQTCVPFDKVTGQGSCTGVAQQLVAIKVDFIAEGRVVSITDVNNAHIQWERLQCDMPFAMNPDGIPLQQKDRNEWRDKAPCPVFHRGCIAWATHSSQSMIDNVFGDGVKNQDPQYYSMTPLYSAIEMKSAPLWPLQVDITGGGNGGVKKMIVREMPDGSMETVDVVPISTYTIIENGRDIVLPKSQGGQGQTCDPPQSSPSA